VREISVGGYPILHIKFAVLKFADINIKYLISKGAISYISAIEPQRHHCVYQLAIFNQCIAFIK
jgi:hypothetical protein